MLGLRERQRAVLIDKVPDLANIAAGALIFGQLLGEGPISPVIALTATLDHPSTPVDTGTALPYLWHWLYFLPMHRVTFVLYSGFELLDTSDRFRSSTAPIAFWG